MPRTRPRSPPSSSSASRAIAKRPQHRQRKACPKARSPGLALRRLLLLAPPPPFFPSGAPKRHDVFVCLETRVGHVYNRREEDVEKEGREHTPLTKALFHSKPPGVYPVVEPHVSLHAIVDLTNDRDHILWHAKTGEYCPEEGSVNGVVHFGKVDALGKVDKTCIRWNSFLPRQLLWPTNQKYHVGGRTVRSKTTLFHRQDPHALTVLTEMASDYLQQYLARARYQRDAPVVAALCPILLFVEYHDDVIFPLLRNLAPPPNTSEDIEQSPAQGGITVQGDFEQTDGDSVCSDSLFPVRQRADGACQLPHCGLNS